MEGTVPLERTIVATEQECMSTLAGRRDPEALVAALRRLIAALAEEAPSLSCGSGLFNAYGRVYVDCGHHLELAARECASPYELALAVETQHALVGRALARVAREDPGRPRLRLNANNHSGLLHGDAPTWGAHENYLVGVHPARLGALLLPFLVTRVYAGAGGVRHPDGAFLFAVRPEFMIHDEGGGTTHERAIHSTCREEHHAGRTPGVYRYHLILGDGHRSQFNLALQLGATALALKAAEHHPELGARLAPLVKRLRRGRSWVRALRELNVMAHRGRRPRARPLALETQRVYLEAAREVCSDPATAPAWAPRALADWEATLGALEAMDRPWLAARLDAFAKYELFTGVLAAAGTSWRDLSASPDAFRELALLDQDYHELCSDRSPFARLEQRGLLAHRVGPPIAPGSEPEPFVPETPTRARARARFLKEHEGDRTVFMDWAAAVDATGLRRWLIPDPFGREYEHTEARLPEELLRRAERSARRRAAAGPGGR